MMVEDGPVARAGATFPTADVEPTATVVATLTRAASSRRVWSRYRCSPRTCRRLPRCEWGICRRGWACGEGGPGTESPRSRERPARLAGKELIWPNVMYRTRSALCRRDGSRVLERRRPSAQGCRSSYRGQIVQIWCFKPKTDDETRGYGRGCVSRVLGNAAPRLTARPCDVRDVWNSFWTISPPRHERHPRADGRRRSPRVNAIARPSISRTHDTSGRLPLRWSGYGHRASRERGDSAPDPALAARPPPTTNPTLAPREASTRARRAPIWRPYTTPRARPRRGHDHGRPRLAVGRGERRRRARRRACLPPPPLPVGRALHRLARLSR